MTEPAVPRAPYARIPRAHDPARAAEARARLPELQGAQADLVAGAAGSAPYLKGLIEKEADWLPAALAAPQEALDRVFDACRALSEAEVKPGLRQAKRRVALLTALMDLAGAWPLETVTGRLSDFADLACDVALRASLAPLLRRGKLPGLSEADAPQGASICVLAMGKMGAGELNYSSDIDLICLFDESRFVPDAFHDARAALVKATRGMCATLSDMTGEGYVFRTDLRLRPDPAVTPVVMAMEAAERYYESLGRTWERAAFIKARPCAGDIPAGQRFLRTLRPFVWRRHLDFAAIEDAHAMRLAIREHKGTGGPITLPGHHMKLGRGGIREIEFFTQTQQLIMGGRDESLRLRGTVAGLRQLAARGRIPEDLARDLIDHYRFHRTVEHRLQMVHDAQTHSLPTSQEGFARLAAMMDRETEDLKTEIRARLEAVHREIERFFAPDPGAPAAQAETPLPAGLNPEQTADITARWRSYPALRTARGAEIFKRLKPEILRRLAETAHPADALGAFDGFLAGLPAGVQVFSLFQANPQLIDLMVDIAGTSPNLARYLSRNAGVFDAVIGGDFWSDWPDVPALTADLTARLEAEEDYEARLDAARAWTKEQHFRIGVHHLRGLITGQEAGAQYADLSQAVLQGLWPQVVAQFAVKHGAPPGRGAALLGMGSLGAGRLTSSSDLDLIVIYDPQDADTSEGPRPLQVRPYYARLTQALVTALSAPMAQGRLYEVDMRLRPSGTQGPVATSWASFAHYQREEAWVWEHLALTRARVIAGAPELGADVEALRRDVLGRRARQEVLKDTAEMRRRIAAAKSPEGPLDAKIGPGRMQDIELLAQAGALIAGAADVRTEAGLTAAQEAGLIDQARPLRDAYALQMRLNMAARLLSDKPLEVAQLTGGGAAFVLRETGTGTLEELLASLQTARETADQVITAAVTSDKDAP